MGTPSEHERVGTALQRYEAGDLEQAERLCTALREEGVLSADVFYLSGLIAFQKGRFEDAGSQFAMAVGLDPGYFEAWFNLGASLAKLGRGEEAARAYRRVIELNPGFPEAHFRLGVLSAQQDLLDEAVSSCEEAVRLRRDFPEAWYTLGEALCNLERNPEAERALKEAIRLKPDLPGAFFNLGRSLQGQSRLEEAAQAYRRALELRPDFARALCNLGSILLAQSRIEEAERVLREAIRLDPQLATAYNNLGLCLRYQGRQGEVVEALEAAVRLRPEFVEARANLGAAFLIEGKFERGWEEYEWRIHCSQLRFRKFSEPSWDGSDLRGRRILVCAEQGFGDSVQFLRYIPSVKRRGGHVVVCCQQGLGRLFESMEGVDEVCLIGQPFPPFDCYSFLLSLPRIFQTRLESVPADVPYLRVEPELEAKWRARLGSLRGRKVGICWRGNPLTRHDSWRSTALSYFEPAADLEEVHLVSLQKGKGSEEIASSWLRGSLVDLEAELTDLAETAAAIAQLDLVVTVDTCIAHLAGALAKPVWVLLHHFPDWRWLLDRDDSPWYPTMRLFRQPRMRDWESVFRRVHAELRAWAEAPKEKKGSPL